MKKTTLSIIMVLITCISLVLVQAVGDFDIDGDIEGYDASQEGYDWESNQIEITNDEVVLPPDYSGEVGVSSDSKVDIPEGFTGTVNINGGEVTLPNGEDFSGEGVYKDGVLTVTNGLLSPNMYIAFEGTGTYSADGTLEIEDGEYDYYDTSFKGKGKVNYDEHDQGNIEITQGTITTTNEDGEEEVFEVKSLNKNSPARYSFDGNLILGAAEIKDKSFRTGNGVYVTNKNAILNLDEGIISVITYDGNKKMLDNKATVKYTPPYDPKKGEKKTTYNVNLDANNIGGTMTDNKLQLKYRFTEDGINLQPSEYPILQSVKVSGITYDNIYNLGYSPSSISVGGDNVAAQPVKIEDQGFLQDRFILDISEDGKNHLVSYTSASDETIDIKGGKGKTFTPGKSTQYGIVGDRGALSAVPIAAPTPTTVIINTPTTRINHNKQASLITGGAQGYDPNVVILADGSDVYNKYRIKPPSPSKLDPMQKIKQDLLRDFINNMKGYEISPNPFLDKSGEVV